MNYGFRIVYHKSIPWSKQLETFLLKQINIFCSPESYKCRRLSGAFYRRGIFGIGLTENFETTNKLDIKYTFKRLSRGKRIFGIVPISELIGDLDLNQCMCAEHRGGQRVNLKVRYNENDYKLVFETGIIKG